LSHKRTVDYHLNENQLVDLLVVGFVPIMGRLASLRDAKWAAAVQLGHQACEVCLLDISDLVELDVLTNRSYCKSLVIRWFHLLEDRFRGTGLTIGQLDERMFPNDVTRRELSEHFSGIGFYYPDTTETDVELIDGMFHYFKLLYCSERDLPPEMIRLLEMHNVPVDSCL